MIKVNFAITKRRAEPSNANDGKTANKLLNFFLYADICPKYVL